MTVTMAGLLVVFFPFILLAFMIMMERVENPLRTAVEDRVEEFLDEARPAEMDTFVRDGLPAALTEHDRRRRLSRLLPRRPIRKGRHAGERP
jgi:Na+-transporting methylmalonyl-CoA/oxaloacetate decarboxylase gamma subunit